MNTLVFYIRDFFRNVNKWILFCCACMAAVFIVLNYKFSIETGWVDHIHSFPGRLAGFYLIYATAFITPWMLLLFTKHRKIIQSKYFLLLLIIAPAIFALKVSFPRFIDWAIDTNNPWQRYFAIISNLPFRLLLVVIPLYFFWRIEHEKHSFWGLTTVNFQWRPYALMLLAMTLLIAFASTQHDFLQAYPKLKQVAFIDEQTRFPWLCRLLFEISYGIDFITIELFFRGFLVFAFVRYVGADAILPMAVFYCSIHFGKPLLECISSFFGGTLLGIIAYRTRSVLGGLMVHVGIAWMMEVGGYIGNL